MSVFKTFVCRSEIGSEAAEVILIIITFMVFEPYGLNNNTKNN